MGKFKEKYGQSRVGKFLTDLSSPAGQLLDQVGDLTGVGGLKALGQVIMDASPKVLSDRQKVEALEQLSYDQAMEQERTERHKNDMASDSWLSKNIRPMTLCYLLLFLTVIVISDSIDNSFKVNQQWIYLIGSLMLSAFGFYFVGRDMNKRILNQKK